MKRLIAAAALALFASPAFAGETMRIEGECSNLVVSGRSYPCVAVYSRSNGVGSEFQFIWPNGSSVFRGGSDSQLIGRYTLFVNQISLGWQPDYGPADGRCVMTWKDSKDYIDRITCTAFVGTEQTGTDFQATGPSERQWK